MPSLVCTAGMQDFNCTQSVSSLIASFKASCSTSGILDLMLYGMQRAIKAVEGFAPQIVKWVKQTPPSAVIEHGLFARRPEVLEAFEAEGWGKGRITFVGDAIHPARPTGVLPCKLTSSQNAAHLVNTPQLQADLAC